MPHLRWYVCMCVSYLMCVCVTSWRPPHRSLCHSTNGVCVGGSMSVSVSVSCPCGALAHVCACVCVPCRFQKTYPCPFMCHDPWLNHISCAAYSSVWHDSVICVTRLIHTCATTFIHAWDMTYSCVWHDSFICVAWVIHMCDMNHSPWSFGGNLHIHSEYVLIHSEFVHQLESGVCTSTCFGRINKNEMMYILESVHIRVSTLEYVHIPEQNMYIFNLCTHIRHITYYNYVHIGIIHILH